jgi:O-antigen/teichoic acid export membrane protein
LAIVYKPDYAVYTDVFVWLMFAAALSYVASFLGYSMTAARYFRIQMPLFALVVISLTVACAVLIPINGILGAAQAMVVSTAVQLMGSVVINIYALRSLSNDGPREVGAGV